MSTISLPKVQNRKHFMDTLHDLITSPRQEVSESGDLRGRPPLLKTYIIESNSELSSHFQFDSIKADIDNTGIDNIKILTMTETIGKYNGTTSQFYLDLSDKRFLVLHTHDLAEDTHSFVKRLKQSMDYEFDSAWLSTSMLKSISKKTGNRDYGVEVDYENIFQQNDDDDDLENIAPKDDLRLHISGTVYDRVLKLIRTDDLVEQTMGYEKITIGRGTKSRGVLDDLTYDGRFSLIRGKSIDDHMVLVDTVKEDYAQQMLEIEKNRIFGSTCDGIHTVEGMAFEFEFNRSVDDWDKYINRIFNAKEPFRIWGIKNKINDGFYTVLAVDLHTGHPVDVEIADNLMRVYLPKGTCGNVVLRLFVNLQRFFDSKIRCPQLNM